MNEPNFKIIEKLSLEKPHSNLDLIVQTIFNEIKIYFGLEPYYKDFKIVITDEKLKEKLRPSDIFKIGTNQYFQNNTLIIEVYIKYLKYLPFILLREIYNLFVPNRIKDFELVQLVINQIILFNLPKVSTINDWRKLIRENLQQYDHVSSGFSRLTAFNRLENFFKLKKIPFKPTRFFFHYIQRNYSLISDKLEKMEEDIHNIFFDEFEAFMSRTINNDIIIETLRCLIFIFYKKKSYSNLLSYRLKFQEFKENEQLQSELSIRKFIKNMDWIKNYSLISPSYQINWKSINVAPICVFLRFNPSLNKTKIYNLLESFPFFISPKISRSSSSIDLIGYIIIPRAYMQDLINFFKKLEDFGYIINKFCFLYKTMNNFLNANYYREFSQKQKLIKFNHPHYQSKYEFEFKSDFGSKYHNPKLDLLDFLIFDRIRFYSVSGLGFERRNETLLKLKSDLLNEILSEQGQIKKLREIINDLYKSPDLKSEFLQFINSNKKFGFFSIKQMLIEYLSLNSFIEKEFENTDYKIFSEIKIQKLLKKIGHSKSLERNIFIKNLQNKDIFSSISLYIKSKEDFIKRNKKFKKFSDLIESCYNLKLFDLNTIEKILLNQNLINSIYRTKESRLKQSYEKYKPYKITAQKIENIVDKLLNHKPSIIEPRLINTIVTTNYVNEFLILVLRHSPEVRIKLENFKKNFVYFGILESVELFSNRKLLYIEISIPFVTHPEKNQLYSTIYNIFKENIIFSKSFLGSGYIPAFSLKNFYDFNNNEFFYAKELFNQYFLYMVNVLNEVKKPIHDKPNRLQANFWRKEEIISDLVQRVNNRVSRENCDFNIIQLKELQNFHLNLKENLQDINKFKEIKQKFYFKNYIDAIKFIPAFQNFGFGQHFLYLCPIDMNEIDFKLLLMNTFQRVKYTACIDDSNTFFIKYIMPYDKPNLRYLNWLTKSKQVIREYSVFQIKKIFQIFHFNYNLSPKGWEYDKNRFKIYIQNILFNPNYDIQVPELIEFKTADKSISSQLGPGTHEYESLINIYNWDALDIKSYIGTRRFNIINNMKDLLSKNLIFPYLSLKNLDLHNQIYIILPNVKLELNKTLLKIFSFFNYGFIYEIEGEYFIDGFPKQLKFENGLMIKLYLPKCELHEFMRIFDLLFDYLEIKDYLVLNDLVDGAELLKSIYGGLDFLKDYNPLKNLKWNSKDKQWMNHKLFTQKFEPIYPDLLPNDKE